MKRLMRIVFVALCFVFVLPFVASASGAATISWGIPSAKKEVPPYPGAKLDAITKKHQALYMGDTTKKVVYFTFDNGYENGFTPKILDTLKEKKVPATFFITGQFIRENPDLVKRMVAEGHIVGNHTWKHPNLSKVDDARFEKELTTLREAFTQLTGQTKMAYMRPPEGVFTENTLALGNKLGYRHVFWSVAFSDWKVNEQKGWRYSYDNVMKKVHPGAVILLHTISSDNAGALPSIIDELRIRGYDFKSIDEIGAIPSQKP